MILLPAVAPETGYFSPPSLDGYTLHRKHGEDSDCDGILDEVYRLDKGRPVSLSHDKNQLWRAAPAICAAESTACASIVAYEYLFKTLKFHGV